MQKNDFNIQNHIKNINYFNNDTMRKWAKQKESIMNPFIKNFNKKYRQMQN